MIKKENQLIPNDWKDTEYINMYEKYHDTLVGRLVWFERTLSTSLFPGPHRAGVRIMGLDTLGGKN